MSIKTFPLTLEWERMITPKVRHLAFRYDGEDAFTFIPGQFITIHFDVDDKQYKRSYSIATIPNQSALIEFAAAYYPGGPGTELLYSLKPGDSVTTSGPFGRLILQEEAISHLVLVATGTGITPYRSMLPALMHRLAQQPTLHITVLLGVQKREDLLYAEDFLALAQQQSRFRFQAHYSREPLTDEHQPWEHTGYVQTAFDSLQLDPAQDVIYLCGNPKMIDDAFSALTHIGFATKNIRREKYISSPAHKIKTT
ncbi:MAG: ferredoxin--NADP reductase [Gammaproteobacteria bacterium]